MANLIGKRKKRVLRVNNMCACQFSVLNYDIFIVYSGSILKETS